MNGGYRRHREFVFERDGGVCLWCGLKLMLYIHLTFPRHKRRATLDHVHPRALGGSGDPENLVLACNGCNQSRGQRLAAWLQATGRATVGQPRVRGFAADMRDARKAHERALAMEQARQRGRDAADAWLRARAERYRMEGE